MRRYTVVWPRHSLVLWVGTVLSGMLFGSLVPELRPLLLGAAWVLGVMPAVAVAAMMPGYARQIEPLGTWSWRAWGYRLSGLAVALMAVAVWSRMAGQPVDDSTLVGILTPLAHVATLALLGLAHVAGAADQRDENERVAAETLRKLQRSHRVVWSGN